MTLHGLRERVRLAKTKLEDPQRPLIVGPCPGQVALGLEQYTQAVQAQGRIGVLRPQHRLPDRQGPRAERADSRAPRTVPGSPTP
jgi:hypothetical protein